MDDYYSLLTNSPLWHTEGGRGLLTLFLLGLARILPIISIAPFFGAKILPPPVKIMLALAIFMVLFPKILLTSTHAIPFDITFILYFSKEIIIGFFLGFLAAAPFYAASMAGSLIDRQRGSASLMALDPTMKIQVSSLGILYNQILIVLFFMINGPFYFIDAVNLSYNVLPPDQFFQTSFFLNTIDNSIFWNNIVSLGANIFTIAVKLGAPSLLVILMTDVFLGIINRMAPQVQIFFLGLPLKSLLAVWILFNSWWYILEFMKIESMTWITHIKKLILSFVQ